MSHMIPTGQYKISNVLYPNRYAHMSGNKEFVGHDVADIIKVEVTDLVQHLATLYDTRTGLYIGVDTQDGKVKGYTDPHVLQLSSDDGIKFEIHPKDLNDVWYLKDGGNWTFIIVEPAPISEGKYWKFDKV
jgi:hypothetical protein